MKRILTIIALAFILGCGGSQVPSNVIKKNKMAKVLADVTLAETKVSNEPMPRDTSQYKAKGYYREVLEMHNVSQGEFKRSMKYYKNNPDVLLKVYEQVVEDLNSMEKEAWDQKE
jgi:hypothetical protein